MVTVFLCEDTMEGVFSGVYDAWDSKLGYKNIRLEIQNGSNIELFTEYREVRTDIEKSKKVLNTIKKKLGNEAYIKLITACDSYEKSKADAIYRTIILGIAYSGKKDFRVMDCLSQAFVMQVFECCRNIYYEAEHFTGFLRFQELKNGVLFSKIKPKNRILNHISSHFANRLINENWLIYDENHKVFSVHKKGNDWMLIYDDEIDLGFMEIISENENDIQELWKSFFETISIQERNNIKCQRNHLPIRFRNNMVEFSE